MPVGYYNFGQDPNLSQYGFWGGNPGPLPYGLDSNALVALMGQRGQSEASALQSLAMQKASRRQGELQGRALELQAKQAEADRKMSMADQFMRMKMEKDRMLMQQQGQQAQMGQREKFFEAEMADRAAERTSRSQDVASSREFQQGLAEIQMGHERGMAQDRLDAMESQFAQQFGLSKQQFDEARTQSSREFDESKRQFDKSMGMKEKEFSALLDRELSKEERMFMAAVQSGADPARIGSLAKAFGVDVTVGNFMTDLGPALDQLIEILPPGYKITNQQDLEARRQAIEHIAMRYASSPEDIERIRKIGNDKINQQTDWDTLRDPGGEYLKRGVTALGRVAGSLFMPGN